MNGFELNKILAAVLMTVLIVFGVGKFTDFLFRVDVPSKPAYVVEAVDNVAKTASISGDSNMSIQELLAMGDLEHGKKVFKKCSACHMIASGGKNMIGRKLIIPMENKFINVTVTDPVFLDKENKRLNA